MSITKRIALILMCLLSIVIGTGYFLGMAYFQTHYKIGTTINGFHCSFKTIEETDALLSRKVESYAIAVDTRNNGVEKITANDVGLAFIGRDELVGIMNTQDSRLWFMPELKQKNLSKECYSIDTTLMTSEMLTLKCMNNMQKAETAHIVNTNDYFQVSKAVKGTELDRAKARDVIETAIRQWKESVSLEETGCYIDTDPGDEKALQKQCDTLNSMQDTIITYDFGDRTEQLNFNTVKEKFLNKEYSFDKENIKRYISTLADKYDTVGTQRKFITYDDRTAIISGGDYGWKINIDKTAEDLLKLLEENTIDVIEPAYTEEAASRNKNDIGRSYLEIDISTKQAILYEDGEPIIQADIKTNGKIKPGFYQVKGIQESTPDGMKKVIWFGSSALYMYDAAAAQPSFSGTDDISGYSASSIKEGCIAVNEDVIDTFFTNMSPDWPVVIYNSENISED